MTPAAPAMGADIVIVGAGVAAAALAQRILGQRPDTSILILEAGGKVKMRDFALYQNYVATGGLPYNDYYDFAGPSRGNDGENRFSGDLTMSLQGSRLMMYGGSTVHWDGYAFRFKPEDFRLKTNTGEGIDWPFDYDELEPYYCDAEDYLGVSGDSADPTVPRSRGFRFRAFPYTLEDTLAIEAFEKLGLGYSHLPIARHGIADTTSSTPPCQTTGTCLYCPFGARYNAANALDELQQNYPAVRVLTNAVARRLLMKSKSCATGVEFFDKASGQVRSAEAGIVVVAGGTIESPKLLQRSTSVFWKHGVGNDQDLVGRHIITHPWITFTATLPANPLRLQPEMAFPTLVSRHFDSEQEQKRGKFVLVNPWVSTNINLAQAMQQGMSREAIDAMVSGRVPVQLNAMFEIFSQHAYRVSNIDKTNHLGMPESLLHFQNTPTIQDRLLSVKTQATRVLRAMGAEGEVAMNADWGAHHATCTTRMSRSAAQGVVDADLRIHDVDNVYVCSNAAFSTLSAINPTLTLTALALRLGDHLLGRLPAAPARDAVAQGARA
jgi:choline dehydrogenase-like flavoprotein